MKDLQQHYRNAVNMVKALDLPLGTIAELKVNTRAMSRWGQCSYHRLYDNYTIEISSRLLADEVKDTDLMNTLIHELLHACDGGMSHTGKWKEYADKVNRAFPTLNIKRTTSEAEKGLENLHQAQAKYKITCEKCHRIVYRTKASSVTQHPNRYHCQCGGCLMVQTLK